MLYVPFTVGALVGSRSSFSPLQVSLLLMSVTFAFIARQSFLEWWMARSRGTTRAAAGLMMLVYVCLAVAIGAPVVFFYHRVWLVPVAILTALHWRSTVCKLSGTKTARFLAKRSRSSA